MTIRQLLATLKLLLGLMWAGTAAAASTVLMVASEVPIVLDPALIALSCMVSTVMGASVLAFTVNQMVMADPTKPLNKPLLLCSSHMLGSWAAGIVAFIISRASHMGPWESLLAVAMFSLGGAKALDAITEKYFGRKVLQ